MTFRVNESIRISTISLVKLLLAIFNESNLLLSPMALAIARAPASRMLHQLASRCNKTLLSPAKKASSQLEAGEPTVAYLAIWPKWRHRLRLRDCGWYSVLSDLDDPMCDRDETRCHLVKHEDDRLLRILLVRYPDPLRTSHSLDQTHNASDQRRKPADRHWPATFKVRTWRQSGAAAASLRMPFVPSLLTDRF